MSQIVNERDLLLQSAAKRNIDVGQTKVLLLAADTQFFHVDAQQNGSPGAITITALPIGIPGTVTFTTNPATLLTGAGNSRVLAYSDMAAEQVVVQASITSAGLTHTQQLVIQKVRDGAIGSAGSRGAGHYYTTGSLWDDSAASAACPGGPRPNDVVTISNGTNYVMEKTWTGSAWLAVGVVINGALIVPGSVVASAINTNGLQIRDQNGNVILGSGVKLDWLSWIANKPTSLSGINSAEGTKLGGIESGATNGATIGSNLFGQLNASNITTYIASAAISSALIASLDAGKITSGTLSITSGGNVLFQVGFAGSTATYRKLNGYNIYAGNLADPNSSPIYGESVGGSPVAGVQGTSYSGSGVGGYNGNNGALGYVGHTSGKAFYSSSGGYGPFTGVHDGLIGKMDQYTLGEIIVDVEMVECNPVSDTIFVVAKSSQPYQQAVGVYAGRAGLDRYVPAAFIDYSAPEYADPQWDENTLQWSSPVFQGYKPKYTYALAKTHYDVASVNALGEGMLLVCGENGDISVGDLIVTSSIPGVGMRQGEYQGNGAQTVCSYTVAKAREAVAFADASEVKQVACIYLAG